MDLFVEEIIFEVGLIDLQLLLSGEACWQQNGVTRRPSEGFTSSNTKIIGPRPLGGRPMTQNASSLDACELRPVVIARVWLRE